MRDVAQDKFYREQANRYLELARQGVFACTNSPDLPLAVTSSGRLSPPAARFQEVDQIPTFTFHRIPAEIPEATNHPIEPDPAV